MWAVCLGAVLLGMGKRKTGSPAQAVEPSVVSVKMNRATSSWKLPPGQCMKMSVMLSESVWNEEAFVCVLKVVESQGS